MKSQNKIVIIVDFCASNFHTHHWSYVKAYKKFIESYNCHYLIFLPKYSDLKFENFSSKTDYCLFSTEYGPKFSQSLRLYILNYYLKKLIKDSNFNLLNRIVKTIFRYLYIRIPLRKISKLSKMYEVTLLFPTMDTLSIALVQHLLRKSIQVNRIALRYIGAQDRGVLSYENSLETIISLSSKNQNIIIGHETLSQRDYLLNSGASSNSLLWAPVPPLFANLKKTSKGHSQNLPIFVGFPGGSKLRKGFDHIPEIMVASQNFDINCIFVFQSAKYLWEDYSITLERIHSSKVPYIMYDSELNPLEFENLMKKLDVIVMPYSPESYNNQGSAIYFQAADMNIPVFVPDQLSLSLEIVRYNTGVAYENFEDLIYKIVTNSKMNNFDFSNFRKIRLKQNKIFLDI
jgi:hypothetical protein